MGYIKRFLQLMPNKNMRIPKRKCESKRVMLYVNKAVSQRRRYEGGFGIVESIASALLLSVLIGLGLTLSTMLENTKYEASLRDAARQSIEDDIEKVKNFLFSLDYLAGSNSSQGQSREPTQIKHIMHKRRLN